MLDAFLKGIMAGRQASQKTGRGDRGVGYWVLGMVDVEIGRLECMYDLVYLCCILYIWVSGLDGMPDR